MASFGDIMSLLGNSLQTGADYGMQQMAGGGPATAPQAPMAPQAQAPMGVQFQDDTKQPEQGAPGMSRLNLLQYLLGISRANGNPLYPFNNNYLGRMAQP
jgi:hypothetical protein